MAESPDKPLSDDDIETVGGPRKRGGEDADGTNGGTRDTDSTDGQDADGTDAGDADGTDAGDADGTDA